MKTKLVLVSAMALFLLVMSACAGQSGPSVVTVAVDDFSTKQVSREVEVPAGSTLRVTLVANPTTGFKWTDSANISDATVISQADHKYIPPESKTAQPVVGASGKDEWTFQALKKGQASISMDYSRLWPGGEKGEWIFKITVTVK